MTVTTLTGRCPACGSTSAFASLYRLHATCPVCSVRFERDDGSYLGSLSVAYGFTILVLAGVTAALVQRYGLFDGFAVVLLVVGVGTVTAVYRPAKAWWLWWLWTMGFVVTDEVNERGMHTVRPNVRGRP